jgi:hypothetical protein
MGLLVACLIASIAVIISLIPKPKTFEEWSEEIKEQIRRDSCSR